MTTPGVRRRVIVFARAPERGRVKTRLAADVGDDAALAIYRSLGERTLAAARAVPACEIEVRYTPPEGGDAIAQWLGPDLMMRPQTDSDLGSRMFSAIADALAEGVSAVVVIGTDCPAVNAQVIDRAFRELRDADVVLGPAFDGGYYLIAMRAAHAELFAGIPWSSPETLACTIAAAKSARLRVTLLDQRADIDTGEDWRRWVVAETGDAPRAIASEE